MQRAYLNIGTFLYEISNLSVSKWIFVQRYNNFVWENLRLVFVKVSFWQNMSHTRWNIYDLLRHNEIFTTCVVTMKYLRFLTKKCWRAASLCFPLFHYNKVIRLPPRLSNIIYFWIFLSFFWTSPGAFFRHALSEFGFCENQNGFCLIYVIGE